MSDNAPQKSHAWNWVAAFLLVLFLYVASSTPIRLYVYNRTGTDHLPKWLDAVCEFLKPADYIQDSPPLKPLSEKWENYWLKVITGP